VIKFRSTRPALVAEIPIDFATSLVGCSSVALDRRNRMLRV
jgi:hypothetical protein